MKKLIICSVIALGSFSLAKAQELKVINYENNIVEYGNIERGSDGKRVIQIQNIGDKPLIIKNASASCGCTVPKWPTEPIAPGKKAEITVTYNTAIQGKFNKSVTIASNDIKEPVLLLRVQGSVNTNNNTSN